jgi:hypothetical protein
MNPLNAPPGVACTALLGVVGLFLWAFHKELSAFLGDHITIVKPTTLLHGFVLKQPLFPQPLNMILRFVTRLLDKLAKCFKACGFSLVEKKLDDLGLRLFMFFFVRFHGDILGKDVVPTPNVES